jgi:DNA uptake protein ComE-like DNA-binding protein
MVIIVLMSIRLLMPYITGDAGTIQMISINAEPVLAEQKIQEQGSFPKAKKKKHNIPGQRFVFNPNTMTEADAQKLGFSKKLCATLINFRNKGGKFFKPGDLKKLYGLPPELYEQIESYILIPNTKKAYKRDSVFSFRPRTYENKTPTREPVEINSADSLSIVLLKGIGPGFTKRIMKYRAKLGGFHSINQLKEVYGMTDSVFALLSSQIKLNADNITRLPINAIDFNSLRRHPYFNFQMAQAVINYRNKHGKLTKEDVMGLGVFSEEKLTLILPYLSY